MDVVAQNVNWLIPEENVPCDVFLHFRGQFAQALGAGQPVTIQFLEKLAKAKYSHIFVRLADEGKWKEWTSQRHRKKAAEAEEEGPDAKSLYGNKRAELVSYLQKNFVVRNDGSDTLHKTLKATFELFQKVIKSPMLDWHFQQFHEPPDLFHHTGRVAISATMFCLLCNLGTEKDIETLLYASLIHELEGDVLKNLNTVVSQQTLSILEKSKNAVPAEVIALIQFQDELCSGKGFPNNKRKAEIPVLGRVFTLFNHFDSYKLKDASTRRARFEQAKALMTARKTDYDDILWKGFWEFWENQMEMLG